MALRWLIGLLILLPARGELLDRIAVTVDKQVITESEVIRDARVAAFLDHKPVDVSAEGRRAAAGRLVDQILMLHEAADSHFPAPSAEDAAGLLEEQKSQYGSEDEYRAALAAYHITEGDVAEHLFAGLTALRFTDLRFRPEVQISDQELRDFYETLAVEWRKTNPAGVPGFEQSRAQVEELLTGQRVMQALDRWLETARQQGQVRYREAAFK